MVLQPQPRAPIDGCHFDVVIIGGGISGVAIARECVRAGRRTLLVEQNDFASGTTSRSTRIIHGGLRYLEYGEIGLVRESLREREHLLIEHPHLVRPMQFVLALPSGRRSAIEIRLGLWLYRRFSGAPQTRASREWATERFLDSDVDDLRIFTYDDAQCEFPERLVAEWLADAIELGAIAHNHTRALEIATSNGKVRGLRLRDLSRGTEYTVGATRIINATGPWVDTVCRESGIQTSTPMIGGVRGSHIVLPQFLGAPTTTFYSEASDGRPIFVIPWNGQILCGTTEVRDSGDPSHVQPDAREIEYLVTSLRRLFPRASLPDISYAFAGIRPLPHAPGRAAASITRRHFLREHAEDGAEGLTSVIGGKLTTAASLARECARHIGIAVAEPRLAAAVETKAFSARLDGFTREIALIAGINFDSARALVSRRGARAVGIAHHIANDDRLRYPLADGSTFLLAEAAFAVRCEAAVTLADVLLRRVPVALGPDWSDDVARQSARRLGDVLGWSETTILEQLDAFEDERSAFLVRPTAGCLVA